MRDDVVNDSVVGEREKVDDVGAPIDWWLGVVGRW